MIILNKTPAELEQILDTKSHKMRMRAMELLRDQKDKERCQRVSVYDWVYGDVDLKIKKLRQIDRSIQRLEKFLK